LIHKNSNRSKFPFVSVNCSALSESLIESELFGHKRGAFTGATHDRAGAFEAARGGTLFLDEIGDLPISLQPKLLRALENREIRPLGSDRNIETNVRIIAATHKNLPMQVTKGVFRADLFFRLNVIKLIIPNLRDRMEDFEDLLYGFCREMRVGFQFDAIRVLKQHNWPGNIRELKNVVARASALFPGQQIGTDQIRTLLDISNTSGYNENSPLGPSATGGNHLQARSYLREIEKDLIIKSLIYNKGNQRRTASDLGIPKSTLHDRIRSYEIDIPYLLREANLTSV
jgi:transcriptional regulator with GAF, ATPase, and Fis domain